MSSFGDVHIIIWFRAADNLSGREPSGALFHLHIAPGQRLQLILIRRTAENHSEHILDRLHAPSEGPRRK